MNEIPETMYLEPTLPGVHGIGTMPALPPVEVSGPNRAQRRQFERMLRQKGDLQRKPRSRKHRSRR